MRKLSDKTFDKHRTEGTTMIVMFHAEFSGPCRMAMPEFELAAGRAGNRVHFYTFDLDGNPNTPEKYGVKGVPQFIVFEDGKPVRPTVGALDCDTILGLLDD